MKNVDTALHVRGESQFVDDIPVPEGTLYAAVYSSPIAHGNITKLDIAPAEQAEGVHGVFTAEDIPGQNQIGNIIPDEPLLASGKVHYVGQPIAIVVGNSAEIARAAARMIETEFEELPAIFDARQAYAQGELIVPPRTFSSGDIDQAWQTCDVVVEGVAESGGQEHLYLETQGTLAYPTESGLKVMSSTQSPKAVQSVVARVLDLPMHQIEVDVLRLGGGFGGKEEQATPWATMAALAAFKLKRPVKLILSRQEDMRMTGKRHPYSSDFKIGLTREGKILAYEVTFYQNAGAFSDLSPSILGRTLLHSTNSYFIPNVRATGISCRTNLPPNTAFRGFGTPQAAFVMESAIFKAAERMDLEPLVIQEKNLLQEGDPFPYGMQVENAQARRCWLEAEKEYRVEQIRREMLDFNRNHDDRKKGLAMLPICYGILFNDAVFLNQAYALVHVYGDGSVGVSTGAVEMGQGVNMKMRQVAARIFSIPLDRIKTESTNTTRVANTSPTSASYSADLNGHATRLACLKIAHRLKEFAARQLDSRQSHDVEIKNGVVYSGNQPSELTWEKLVSDAYVNRINLSAQAHYATPGIQLDKNKEKTKFFAHYVFGVAIIEVTLDCIRGVYQIDSIKVVHDFGESLDPLIDQGQMEGGIAQGLGWMTIEELNHTDDGKLVSDGFLTYKAPDIHSAPQEIQISFLKDSNNSLGIFNSKAIGEPPFMYGIGVYFAISRAMKAFRPNLEIKFSAPMTPEKLLLSLYEE
uniref:Xanthine dehydrogenase large subunit n=1 Tax=Candidatus Kentrum sp. MB TaxID=2138164 RepID=A0A451BEQ3_9GAMM|nr:MAG: xanthine dehydrogenase large subunit [Candidatus Kentron sp. MB]VFK76760.1 MAG: xanthine dehydrogenase large subunit [Candidatus Kentron sp. MB]